MKAKEAGKRVSISKRIEWNMGHRIPNHEKDNNPNGHSFALEVTLEGFIDDKSGMLVDLQLLKKIMNEHIVSRLDHSFVIWREDAVMTDFFAQNPELKHIVLEDIPTLENILLWIRHSLENAFSEFKTISLRRLRLWESSTAYASVEM
ncbi:MAG: 6-carboxytetrahydropterin synthase [Candidatus Aenigmarchaeota archaeon]|nr:6-carboxytetrahydropterin synthase [Candidatus Aenigmarchaeota archaeon]